MAIVETVKASVNKTFTFVHGGGAAANLGEAPRDLCPGEFHVCGLACYIVPAYYACGECYSAAVPDCSSVWKCDNPFFDCDVDEAVLCVKGSDLWLDLTDPAAEFSDGSELPVNGYTVLVTEPSATAKYLGTVEDHDVTTASCSIRIRPGKAPVTEVTKATPDIPVEDPVVP